MASKELSIKVKVNLPTAGEIENQIQRSLRGLKDIKVDANVKLKVGKLGNLKRQLRNALGKENFRVNANVKVHGMSELNRVSSKLKEIRRLANEPIKLNVDMGGHDFDKSIEEARRKANKELENISPHSSSAMLAAQKEMRAQQHAIERAQKEYLRAQNQAVKASDERIKQNMQHYASQIAKQQEEAERQYATAARRAGLSDSEISKNVLGFREQPKARMTVRNSEIQQQIKQEEAALRNYKRAVDEATRAQVSMVKGRGNIGNNQIRELGNEYERAAQKVQKYARALRSTSRAEEAADYRAAAESKVRMAEAKRADGEYRRVRRAKSSGSGIMNTLNTWDVLQTGAMAVAGVVSGVNEVDKAITKVTKVVPDSQAAVNRWKKNIYRDAAEVGKTAPEFASAVEQWATAGYNLKQSNRLAKTSVMGAFVGEVPVNDMVRYMSVPMKAFQKEGLKSVDIVNAMNQVSNKHAIEMDDLGQAYQKASATMGSTGTTFAQMTGIITAAQEGTRAGGDVIGTAFKTISANLSQIGGQYTKQAKTKNDYFNSLGVQLKDSHGKMKSTYQIMDQLSKKWKTMDSEQKQRASTYAAGKEHANIFSATMDNWDTAKDAMREAEDQKGLGTSGSAYKEMEKQKQSIEFQLKGLQDTWMSFLQNLSGGREGIGQMLSIATGFGKVLDGLAENKLFSSTARWGILSAGLIMARKGFAAVAGSFGEMVSQGKKSDSFIERLTGIKKKTDAVKDSGKELKSAWNDLLGKSKSSKKLPGEALGRTSPNSSREGIDANGIIIPASVSDSTQKIKENTTAKRKNAEVDTELSKGARKVGNLYTTQGAAIEMATDKAKTHGKVMTKVSKGWGVLKAGAGVLSASLGYVGLALDAVTIAGATMEALGIHPIKMLKAAMDPAGESAKQLDKYIGKVGKSVEKTSSAIEGNGLITGQLTADLKSVGDMKEALGSLQVQDGKYTGDNFEQLKKNFNEIAKHNGLELRIRGGESVDAVNSKVEALNKNMDVAKKESALDLGKNVSKNIDNVNKLLSDKNLDKLRDSNREYNRQLDTLKAKYQRRGSHGEFLGYDDGFQQQKRKLDESISWGKNNEAIWNSKQGKEILSNVHKAQRSVRDAIDGMASALNDGTLSVDNLKSMNDRGRQAGALALVKNLQGLRGSSDQGKKDDITKQLSSILTNASQKQIQAIAKYADKEDSNGKLLGALSKAGIQTEILASMAGIGAQAQQQYSSRYGKNWIQKAVKDQSDFDSFSSKKGNKGATNLESLINQNTGFIDYDRIAKFNSGRATYGEGRRRLKSTGLKYNSKDPLSAIDIGKATMGLDGDAITTLNDITDGKATSRQIMAVANNNRKKYDKNNNVVKGSGATAKQLVQAVAEASKGRGNLKKQSFDSTIDDMVADGLITKEQGERATKQRSKNYTRDGYAKNYKAAMDQIGDKQLTENAFKNYAKNLDKNARKQLADQLKKNDQISKNAYNDLTKDFAKGTSRKSSKKTPKTAKEAEKQLGNKKISQSDLKALQKSSPALGRRFG